MVFVYIQVSPQRKGYCLPKPIKIKQNGIKPQRTNH
jgi:hypothetical protein